jgi:hypothetical protein
MAYEPFWYMTQGAREWNVLRYQLSVPSCLPWDIAEAILEQESCLSVKNGTTDTTDPVEDEVFVALYRHDLWSVYLYPRVNREI